MKLESGRISRAKRATQVRPRVWRDRATSEVEIGAAVESARAFVRAELLRAGSDVDRGLRRTVFSLALKEAIQVIVASGLAVVELRARRIVRAVVDLLATVGVRALVAGRIVVRGTGVRAASGKSAAVASASSATVARIADVATAIITRGRANIAGRARRRSTSTTFDQDSRARREESNRKDEAHMPHGKHLSFRQRST